MSSPSLRASRKSSRTACPFETIQSAPDLMPGVVEIEGVSMDNTKVFFSASFKLCLRFQSDFEPLPDLGGGLGRVFQFIQITGSDPLIDLCQIDAHVGQLLFQRVDRGGQAGGPLVGGDQNHACSCLMSGVFRWAPLSARHEKTASEVSPGAVAHFVQHVTTYT